MENIENKGDEISPESAPAENIEREEIKREAAREERDDARRRALYLVVGAACVAAIFWWLQFSTGSICCGDFDGYYHTGWSRMLWQGIKSGNFPPAFTQLPLTTLNAQDYVDHHFLFHILQIPFTWFSDPVFGAKVGAALFAALAVFACYWMLVRQRVAHPLIWLAALLACATPFLYRMSMAKAMSLSIVLLVVGIYLLFERKYFWLAPLAFLFALTYDMFVLLGVASVIWLAVVWWGERGAWSKPVRRAALGVVLVGTGAALGFVINPYFPHNVQLLFQHAAMKMTPKDFSTAVGGEWYPYTSWEFLGNCFVAFVATVAGLLAFNGQDRKASERTLFLLVFSTLLLVVNARWKRFAEYWPPFAVLFAAFSLKPYLDGARASIGRLPEDVLDELQPFLDRHDRPEVAAEKRRTRWLEFEIALVGLALGLALYFTLVSAGAAPDVKAIVAVSAVAVALLVGLLVYARVRGGAPALAVFVMLALTAQAFVNARVTANDIAGSAPPEQYRKAAEWMNANIPPGEIIFNTDWDDFPRLFYFAPRHAYVSGLDPTYLYDKNRDLSRLYEGITVGREENPAPLIRQHFNSRYVFTDKQEAHDDFFHHAMDSGWFEEVYDDEECTILRILDERREPKPDGGEQNETAPVPEEPGEPADDGAQDEATKP